MSKFRRTTDNIVISKTLPDGESGLFVRCKVFNEAGTDITNSVGGAGGFIALSNVYRGFYHVNLANQFPAEGQYIVVFEVFDDAGFTEESEKYGMVEEDYRVSNFEQTILDEVPDNILLDDDARLDNLNDIPDLATEANATTNKDDIINQVNENIDSGESRTA